MIPGLATLHKTGLSDSNLLSIQRWGKKNASYSAAVQPESWRGCSLDSPNARKKPASPEWELNQINLAGWLRRVFKQQSGLHGLPWTTQITRPALAFSKTVLKVS